MADEVISPVVETPAAPKSETAEQKYERLYNTKVAETPPVVVAPAPPPADSGLLASMEALKAELASVRAAVTPKPPDPKPITPWFEQLRQGDWEGAEKDLISRVEAQVLAKAKAQASTEGAETTRVQIAIDRYLSDLRGQNPDIAPMERYLEAPVAKRVELAQKAGKISSSDDFIREYKAAVDAEVSEMRKITGQFRSSGKEEAMTRTQQVLSSTPLVPQQVSTKDQGVAPTGPPTETVEDYFTRRKAIEALRKGMGPTV